MLTSKQKAKLKGLAMKEPAIFQVGKNNLNENLIKGLDDALASRELVKIGLLKTSEMKPKKIAKEICVKTNSSLVEIKGKTAVFYRQSDKKIINLD